MTDHRPALNTVRTALLGAAAVLLAAAPAAAQPAGTPRSYQSSSVFDASAPPTAGPADCDRPSELPPLLAVPPAGRPAAPGPSGPPGEYDPGYFYIPDRAPDMTTTADPPCGPAGRFWFIPTIEFAGTKSASVPALVRVGSLTGPVAYGADHIAIPDRVGLSLTSGAWLDAQQIRGVDASFYYLGQGGTNSLFYSNGAALILPTANGAGYPLADPAAGQAGAYEAALTTRFSSADVNFRRNLLCGPRGRLDALVGYRFADLGELFEVYGKEIGPGGEIIRFRDDATATNQFHGGQIGLAGEYRVDKWYVGATGKVAFGTVFTQTDLSGKFRVDGNVIPSGFYARPGTAGEIDTARFGVMPTVGLTFGRQLGDHGRVFVGYNLLYLTGMTRAPDVLDPLPNVLASNPQAVSPATTTQRAMAVSDFWVQSASLGLEWRF